MTSRALLLGVVALVLCSPVMDTGRLGASELRETATVKAVRGAEKSVVSIRGEKTISDSSVATLDQSRRVNGMGTGVIIDQRGYILTNHHVVDGVREITVTLYDATRYKATLVARDPDTDLAVIKIDSDDELQVIRVGRSNDLMTAEPVIAIGNPYGYTHTVTTGIISNLHRALQVSEAQFYEDLIQTSAPINPGNSGGPLLNIDGEMIGVTVAVRTGAQGIAFAIPADKVMRVIARLIEKKSTESCRHGIQFDREGNQLAIIESVEAGSPAELAGLQPKDVIKSIGSMQLDRELDFHRAVLGHTPDETLSLTVQRAGQSFQCDLTLNSSSMVWTVLGLDIEPVNDETFKNDFPDTIYRGGMQVRGVRKNGPAAKMGIVAGDVLVGLHTWQTISRLNVNYILNESSFQTLSPVKCTILRKENKEQPALFGFMEIEPLNHVTMAAAMETTSSPIITQIR